MKKPVINYREFRLSKLWEPRFRHLLLLVFWPVDIALFFITERIYPLEACFSVHSILDDMIPFCEAFVIPYVLWYVFIAFAALFFLFYDVESFKRFHLYLIVTDIIVFSVYCIFPTRVDFQPTEFPRDNVLTDLVKLLYAADMNTDACPSLHVAFSLAVASAWSKCKQARLWSSALMWFIAALICISTAAIKQHSVLDFFWALPVCLIAECVAYGRSYWFPKLKTMFPSGRQHRQA